jgi:hypothetical protein
MAEPTPTPSQPAQSAEPPRPWVRGLYMAIFWVSLRVADAVLTLLTLVQYGWLLAYREPQPALKRFGDSLAQWVAQVVRFQTAGTEERPFPWSDWPEAK